MAVYTVHEPPPRAGEVAADPERFVFVRDGFHFWAFLLGPLWMLRYRLWLVLVLYLVVMAVLHAALWALGIAVGLRLATDLLLAILVGLEAPTLRRWTLGRRRWLTLGVVVADDVEMAERRFFDTWNRDGGPSQRPPATAPAASPPPLRPPPERPTEVLGLFPQPGGPR
jgi:hypothetical protein